MLTDIRMHKARELRASGLPLSAIASQVGYQHANSLGEALRKYWGRG